MRVQWPEVVLSGHGRVTAQRISQQLGLHALDLYKVKSVNTACTGGCAQSRTCAYGV